jgi:signal transduction histidine kinase
MTTVNESATSLMDIVNDVLISPKLSRVNWSWIWKSKPFKLTNQVINLFKIHRLSKKNINLILDIDKSVPQYVIADSVRLKQISKLVGNAIKFTHFGEIRLISVKLIKWKQSAKIKFSVKDTGVGIKIIITKKIFKLCTRRQFYHRIWWYWLD